MHQYTLIIDGKDSRRSGEDRYYFKNFMSPNIAIAYISDLSNGKDKVHRIVRMNHNGSVSEFTVGFVNGKLTLEELPNECKA